jgi:hypothetical protein
MNTDTPFRLPAAVHAPFTPEQVIRLTEYQERGYFHQLTCPMMHTHEDVLFVRVDGSGLECPTCHYEQTWVPAVCLEEVAVPVPCHPVYEGWFSDRIDAVETKINIVAFTVLTLIVIVVAHLEGWIK